MDTRLIATFLTVARCRNFTQAAAELHLAQSTVTAQIKALEADLGVQLFDRLPSGAALSEAGRRVEQFADELVQAETALREGVARQNELRGTVAVGASESLCAYLLPKAISSLHLLHPDVDVKLLPVGTREAKAGLRAGTLGLALLLETSVTDADIDSETLGPVDLMFIQSRQGGSRVRDGMSWRHLSQDRWFLLEEGCSYSDKAVQQLRKASGQRCLITRLGSVEAVRACVAEGLGVAVLPSFAVTGHSDRLTAFEGPKLETSILLATDGRRSVGPVVEAAATALKAAAARLDTPGR